MSAAGRVQVQAGVDKCTSVGVEQGGAGPGDWLGCAAAEAASLKAIETNPAHGPDARCSCAEGSPGSPLMSIRLHRVVVLLDLDLMAGPTGFAMAVAAHSRAGPTRAPPAAAHWTPAAEYLLVHPAPPHPIVGWGGGFELRTRTVPAPDGRFASGGCSFWACSAIRRRSDHIRRRPSGEENLTGASATTAMIAPSSHPPRPPRALAPMSA